jgi:hypothetical protein
MTISIPSGFLFDRATVVTTAVLQITTASSLSEIEQQLHVENLLRDEFDDIKRQAIADRDLGGENA